MGAELLGSSPGSLDYPGVVEKVKHRQALKLWSTVMRHNNTSLCLNCLKTRHNECPCGGYTINLGHRLLARWVSQNQGDRKAILRCFDQWRYQSPWIQEARFLVWLHGFPLAESIKRLHPDRWKVLANAGIGIEQICYVDNPDWLFGSDKPMSIKIVKRWLLLPEQGKRQKVELI